MPSYEARIDSEASGLSKPSRVVANQIHTIARHRITKRMGRLSPSELEDVDRAVALQIGLRIEL